MKFEGMNVLVTGANGGIGRAIAREIRKQGANLVLSGRNREALAPFAQELDAELFVADLAERPDVQRLAERAGEVDVVVANAAVPATSALTSFSVEEIDRILDVNLRACILLARQAAQGMAQRGQGRIIFVSSTAGLMGTPYFSMYCATKFALRGFSLSLRAELQPLGIGVTTIFPGFIRNAGMFAKSATNLPSWAQTRTPEDVARAVLRAVHKAPAEITVAGFDLRLLTLLGHLFPDLNRALQRAVGGDELIKSMVDGQRAWRA